MHDLFLKAALQFDNVPVHLCRDLITFNQHLALSLGNSAENKVTLKIYDEAKGFN